MSPRNVELSRFGLGKEYNIPYLRTGLPQRGAWTGWGQPQPEPQNLWQRMTPWHEEEGETFGSAVAPVAQGVGSFFRTLGTPFAAPFLRAQMTPEEKKKMDVEWQENPWGAVFGSESQMAEKYEDMPWWAKILAEAPSMLVGGGLAGAGIKGIAGAGLSRLATQTGARGAAARIGSAALTPFGGQAKQVFQQAGRAGGISGRAAQAISAPMAGLEVGTGILTKGAFKLLTLPQKQLLKRLKLPQTLTDTQQRSAVLLAELIEKAPAMIRGTSALRTAELGKRVGKVSAIQKKLYGEESLKAMGALKTPLPVAKRTRGFESVRSQLGKPQIDDLHEAIKSAKFAAPPEHHPLLRMDTQIGLQKLTMPDSEIGLIPTAREIQLLGNVFGENFQKIILDKRSMGSKALELAVDLANLPRAMLASMDLSGLLRQGGILTTRDPLTSIKAVGPMLKAVLSDKNAGLADDVLRMNSDIAENLAMKGSLELTSTTAGKASFDVFRTGAEEAFRSSLAERIPILGPLIKASNRAYSTVLNQIRGGNYTRTLKSWRKMGLQEESVLRAQKVPQETIDKMIKAGTVISDLDKRELGRMIMNATGRAPLPSNLQGASGLLGTVFFSPRLIMAKAMFPKYLLATTPKVRREAWKAAISFVGAGASILTAAAMSGAAKIELDPTSADFGKIRIGDTRLDIWTGYQQFIRLGATLATEHRKTQAGAKVSANRYDTALRFTESKLSPAMGLLKDILKGETYLGEELTAESGFLTEQAFNRIAPLAIQDMIDAMEQEGPLGGVIASPAFLGVGIMSYPPPTAEQMYKANQQMAYAEIENNVWGQIPGGKEIYEKSEEYKKTDPNKARRFLGQYPSIVTAVKKIELEKRRWVLRNKRQIQPLGFARNKGGRNVGRTNRSIRRFS